MTDTLEAETQNQVALVVFGLDATGKPHASAFFANDADLAEKAAGLMGMRVLRPETDEQRQIAAKLPRGRVFASGRAFVPFVRAPLYAAPAAFGGVAGPIPPETDEPGCTGAVGAPRAADEGEAEPHFPATWADITVGSIVLASIDRSDGRWESVVVSVHGDLLKLIWRDYPKDPVFVRRHSQVALLPV